MIKLGTQVKSKVHDDLTGSVVLLERSNNYAVVKTHIHDYETYNYLIDLFHPDFHKSAIKQRVAKLKEGFES